MTSQSGQLQLHLDFPRQDGDARPLIRSGPYATVLSALDGWRTWPDGQLALIGPDGAGKTRLLRHWAASTGAAFVSGPELGRADMASIKDLAVRALAVDDADRTGAGRPLMAALNLCRDRQAPILVSGESQPRGWYAEPRDLVSRTQAMPVAAIGLPDDDTLHLRLMDACARRHLNVPEKSIGYLVARMEPSWQAIERLADAIETTRGRAETLKFARDALAAAGMACD